MDDTADIRLEARWKRRASDAWTTRAFRAPVLAFARELGAYGWVADWEVTERFASTAHEARGLGVQSVNVRVPRVPPYQPPEAADFRQRPGARLLIIAATRKRDGRRFEVGLSFSQGPFTPAAEVSALLDRARASIAAENLA